MSFLPSRPQSFKGVVEIMSVFLPYGLSWKMLKEPYFVSCPVEQLAVLRT
jgi:hypothetical protein